jgi:hypothetical protein
VRQLKATNGQNNPSGTLCDHLPPTDVGRGTNIIVFERVLIADHVGRVARFDARRPTDSPAVTAGATGAGRTAGATRASLGAQLG